MSSFPCGANRLNGRVDPCNHSMIRQPRLQLLHSKSIPFIASIINYKDAYYMRFPSIPTIIRTFTIYNLTSLRSFPSPYRAIPAPPAVRSLNWSMPTFPFLGSLFGSQQKRDMTDYPVKKSDDEWQAVLSPEQFKVIRQKGTEAPYTGEYDKHMPSEGTYVCPYTAPLLRATGMSN